MAKWKTAHVHLTRMVERGTPIERLPEMITGRDAAQRLLEEMAARYVEKGCRVKNYGQGIRIYDCRNGSAVEQSFKWSDCEAAECAVVASEAEYGRWAKPDRANYINVLIARGILT